MTGGEKLALSAILVGVVGFGARATYGDKWQETRNEEGSINGIELIHDNEVSASNTSLAPAILDPTNKTQIKQSLIRLAEVDPWCSSSYLAVKAEDILPTDTSDKQVIQQSDAVVNVQVCLDAQTIDVRDGYVVAFFGTNPQLQTGEGRPSVYLTYKQDVLLPQCKETKEDMRKQLQEDIMTVLGATAAQNFETEIHVNKDYMGHPCDDLFIEP